MNYNELRHGTRVRFLKDFADRNGYPIQATDEDMVQSVEKDADGHITIIFRDGPPMSLQQFGENVDEYLQLFDIPPITRSIFRQPLPPEIPAQLPSNPENLHAALRRIGALVAHGKMASAEAALLQANQIPDRTGYESQGAAELLGDLACQQPSLEGFEWMWDKAFNYWYSWGSGASAGGEGAYRGEFIKRASRRYDEQKKLRQSQSAIPPDPAE